MNIDDKTKFSNRLREVIHALKMKDKDFADAGGITKQTLSGYLRGKREPSQSTIANWVLEFHLNAQWLLTGEGEMFSKTTACKAEPGVGAIPANKGAEYFRAKAEYIGRLAELLDKYGATSGEIVEAIKAVNVGEARNHQDASALLKGAANNDH